MNPTARVAPMSLVRLTVATTIVLSGCASSLSGVGGTDGYACKAPIGAQCTSVSGVYANASPLAARAESEAPPPPQDLVATTSGPAPARQSMAAPPTATSMPSAASAVATATPAALRSPPRVMRLWIAPWEDADGDLHDASFVHVVIDTGRWLIERVRPAARSKLDIATPPLAPPASIVNTPPPETNSPADPAPTEP
jgi:conjugal transfer pilus assembly protein TraV